jgi:L-malate glycosyltransferase
MSIHALRQKPCHIGGSIRCRLLYLVGQLRLGGLERQLYYLLSNLDQALHRPAVVVWNLDPSEKYYKDIQDLKIPIYGFPVEMSSLFKLIGCRVLARQVAAEVIHSYGFHTNFAAYYAACGTGAVAIGSLRSDFSTARRAGGLIRGILNATWPAYSISNSSTCAEAVRRQSVLFAPRHISVVRNGLDLKYFTNSQDKSQLRSYVAAVGSLFPVKRWDRLLRVVKKANSIGLRGTRFRIAGDGPLRPALERLARDLDLSEHIEFLGATQDIPALLREAKFLVHTSESEGCPNAVMEAMACRLPVVAMDAGDISYLVEDGKTGFVVRQDDEETFARRVLQLLDDAELCNSMGAAAQAKAEREFRLERLVSQILAVYKSAGWQNVSLL